MKQRIDYRKAAPEGLAARRVRKHFGDKELVDLTLAIAYRPGKR